MPESFKVLIKELQALALDIQVLDENKQLIELKELENDEDDLDTPIPAGREPLPEDDFMDEGGAAEDGEDVNLDDDLSLDDDFADFEVDDVLDDLKLDDDDDIE